MTICQNWNSRRVRVILALLRSSIRWKFSTLSSTLCGLHEQSEILCTHVTSNKYLTSIFWEWFLFIFGYTLDIHTVHEMLSPSSNLTYSFKSPNLFNDSDCFDTCCCSNCQNYSNRMNLNMNSTNWSSANNNRPFAMENSDISVSQLVRRTTLHICSSHVADQPQFSWFLPNDIWALNKSNHLDAIKSNDFALKMDSVLNWLHFVW